MLSWWRFPSAITQASPVPSPIRTTLASTPLSGMQKDTDCQIRAGTGEGIISPPLKSPKLQVPYAQMTARTQQDMPQTETPKLQHIPTTKRASTSSTSCRIGSTRFHTSAQETVGSGAFVSVWLLLENTIPLQRWRNIELFHQNFGGGKFHHCSSRRTFPPPATGQSAPEDVSYVRTGSSYKVPAHASVLKRTVQLLDHPSTIQDPCRASFSAFPAAAIPPKRFPGGI